MLIPVSGISSWCCRDIKENTTIIEITEGKKKIIALRYKSPHSRDCELHENPRNGDGFVRGGSAPPLSFSVAGFVEMVEREKRNES